MKTDLRVVKTHQAIRGALVSLLKTKPFADIAAQEIYATALVNRTTLFYKYSDTRKVLYKARRRRQYVFCTARRRNTVQGFVRIAKVRRSARRRYDTTGARFFSR